MEVKPGYRQTDVGVIPEKWNVFRLDACVRRDAPICYGILMPGPHCNYGVPVVKVRDVIDGRIVESGLLLTHPNIDDAYRRSRLAAGDLLVTIRGTTGRLAVVPASLEGANITQDTARVRPSTDIDAKYLYFALCAAHLQRQIALHTIGQAVRGINIRDVKDLAVVLPDSAVEQRAIAAALSDVDALLGGLDRLIAKKRDLKQAAMQQLLTGQTRLPGFSGAWEVKRLGDVGRCLRGVSYRGDVDLSTHDTPHTKRLLRSNNIQNAVVVTDEVQFVNAARVSSHQVLQQDDILICMANGSKALVGKAGIFTLSDGHEYTFGAFMGCFRTKSTEANPVFVFYLFLTARYRDYINNLLAGSSINNLRPSSIESLEFSTPLLPEQAAIAAVLSDIDAELAALEARRDKTRDLKQAMMQELLTGRTRLV